VIRVGIVDDHALVRAGLRALLQTVADVEVVGEGGSAQEARRVAVTERPDVLVLDVNLPDGSGIEVVRALRSAAPEVAVLMLTMYDDDQSVLAAIRAGARGYVLKGADPEEVVRAIYSVAAGGAVLGPGVAGPALGLLSAGPAAVPFPELTGRERDVLELIAQGLGNVTIAQRLGVAASTISNHVTSIFAKLQVSDRSAAIVKARNAGLGAG
jgi:DNA-binding NarL/FixJ family response regulator